MSYWVYENWTRDRARLHRAECGYCNDGRGTQPADSGRNGRWRFAADLQSARAILRNLKRADKAECGYCLQPCRR